MNIQDEDSVPEISGNQGTGVDQPVGSGEDTTHDPPTEDALQSDSNQIDRHSDEINTDPNENKEKNETGECGAEEADEDQSRNDDSVTIADEGPAIEQANEAENHVENVQENGEAGEENVGNDKLTEQEQQITLENNIDPAPREDETKSDGAAEAQNVESENPTNAEVPNVANESRNGGEVPNQNGVAKDSSEERPRSVISVEIKGRKSNEGEIVNNSGEPVIDGKTADVQNQPLQKDQSFIDSVQSEAKKVEQAMNLVKSKRIKKGIFVSYSPDAQFLERKFVVELVNQLKGNNMAEDIWFDKDEKNTDSSCWFSQRMEAAERCRAAILVLTDSFFTCPVSVCEGKVLLQRHLDDPESVKVFLVLLSPLVSTTMPAAYNQLKTGLVDLTGNVNLSAAEKTSIVIGNLSEALERCACMNAPPGPASTPDSASSGLYKKKKICQWSAGDLQEWLFSLGIKEFYRQNFAENMVDGFLLMSMTDDDMKQHFCIDSKVARKKIMTHILLQLDKEQKLAENWHLRARRQKSKANTVYLIYDPADSRLASRLRIDLTKRGLAVVNHQKLGKSKEEFLQLNASQMAIANTVLILLTEAATASPFVFHEILFSDWLGKKAVMAMFKNTWRHVRAALKAVLGECPTIDFETKLYGDSLSVLNHHLNSEVPGVVLEQAYLNKMTDGIKPFGVLAASGGQKSASHVTEPDVFISYQWDAQTKVGDLRRYMESNHLTCWADIGPTMSSAHHTAHSTRRNRSSLTARSPVDSVETLQSQIHRNMRSASVVLCCITPKYIQSDNCVKDLTLADTLRKPIVPVMFKFCQWPPEGAPLPVKKILARLAPVDMSNEKLFKMNVRNMLDAITKIVSQSAH